jgi:hypothetical protein
MSKPYLFASLLTAGLTLCTAAGASVFSPTATLPLLGQAYATSGGGSCFPAAGACFQPGVLTFTSVVPSPPAPPAFNASGQDIVVNAFFTGELTDLSLVPIGQVTLTGTVEQEVLGRTSSVETGSWTTDLVSIDLTGAVLGRTLTMQLDGSTPSTGTTSIVLAGSGDNAGFLISSFFDVFVDLSLDGTTPLHTTREAQLELVPEPASIALLSMGTLGLAMFRRKRT